LSLQVITLAIALAIAILAFVYAALSCHGFRILKVKIGGRVRSDIDYGAITISIEKSASLAIYFLALENLVIYGILLVIGQESFWVFEPRVIVSVLIIAVIMALGRKLEEFRDFVRKIAD